MRKCEIQRNSTNWMPRDDFDTTFYIECIFVGANEMAKLTISDR